MIDFELTDEQRLIRETARNFADNEIVPRVRDNDRNERFENTPSSRTVTTKKASSPPQTTVKTSTRAQRNLI